jgi:hypothetical protein
VTLLAAPAQRLCKSGCLGTGVVAGTVAAGEHGLVVTAGT